MSQCLEVEGLVKSFASRRVVDGVSIDVRPGEIVGLLGPNGAGKTTCFGMIAGLVEPDQGTVQIDQVKLDGLPLWRRVRRGLGYLAQGPTIFRALSVAENIDVVAAGGKPLALDVDALLAKVGLTERSRDCAGNLSGGERRRLEIARCLATEPRYVLLDEPFSGVDPVGVQDLQGLVRILAEDGIGVLLTDHAVREALGVCDRAVVLDGGRVVASGKPSEVAAESHVKDRYLGSDFSLYDADVSDK